MISCINCNRKAAIVSDKGLVCTSCKYEWSFAEEANSPYARLNRAPIVEAPSVPATAVASEGKRDDLTQIDGVGVAKQAKLNGLNIFTFEQLAKASKATIVSHVGESEETVDAWIDAASEKIDAED